MSGPASGAEARAVCNCRYESSERYSSTSLLNSFVSMNVITIAIIRQRRTHGKKVQGCQEHPVNQKVLACYKSAPRRTRGWTGVWLS